MKASPLEGMVPIAVSSVSAAALGVVGAGGLLDDRRHALMMEATAEYLALVHAWAVDHREAV